MLDEKFCLQAPAYPQRCSITFKSGRQEGQMSSSTPNACLQLSGLLGYAMLKGEITSSNSLEVGIV